MGSPPAKVIANGLTTTLARRRLKQNLRGMDECSLLYRDCDAEDVLNIGSGSYGIGDACPSPYGGLRITGIDSTRVPSPSGSEQFDLSIEARGLFTASSRVIARQWKISAHGWDTCTERRVIASAASWPHKGHAMSGYANMRYIDGGIEDQLDNHWELRDYVYMGFRDDKLVKRKVSCNNNTVTPGNPTKVTLTGGWSDYRKATIQMPRIVVEDLECSTSAVDTSIIPGTATPPDAPSIQSIVFSGDITYNWPHGWVYTLPDSEELYYGAGLYIHHHHYEFVWTGQLG